MHLTASIASSFAASFGLLAGAIAVFGFIAQAYPVLSDASDRRVRRFVVTGGLVGFMVGAAVIVLSAIVG